MKIAIDARWIFPEISGIGAYTRELIHELSLLDHVNEYVILFSNSDIMERIITQTSMHTAHNFHPLLVNCGVFSPRSQITIPRLLRRARIDLYHSPNYMIPFFSFPRGRAGRTKCVATIHDVIPLLFPDHAPRSRKSRLFWIYKRLMQEVGRRADAIITVSEASRSDTISQLQIPENQRSWVRAIHNGVSSAFKPPKPSPLDP